MSEAVDPAPWLVHAGDVPEVEGHYEPPFDGEELSFGRDLGRAGGSVALGLRLERLPPGRRSGFTHAHSHEEELVYVLAGEALARIVEPGQPPRELPIRAGDVMAFPAGTGIAHTVHNREGGDCVLLVAGERNAADRCFYPDDAAYDAHRLATEPQRSWRPPAPAAPSPGGAPRWLQHVEDVPEEDGHYPAPFDGERLSFSRDLGRAAGSVRLGMRLERIPAGWRTSFTHAHSAEEELAYVVHGTCAARVVEPGLAPREVPLRAGHLAAFPGGTGIAHTFVNRGATDCLLLGFGERRADDRVFYPEDTPYDEYLAAARPARWWRR